MNRFILFLLPTRLELIIYFFISAFLLVIGASTSVFKGLINPSIIEAQSSIFSYQWQQFLNQLESTRNVDVVTTVAFWSAGGAVIYIVIWLITGVIRDLANEVNIALVFNHPRSFHQSDHWVAYGARLGFRAAIVLLSIFYALFFVQFIYPTIVNTLSDWALTSPYWQIALYFGLFTFLLMLAMHCFVILARLFMLRLRVFR
ncbi:hypothetical protein DYH10_01355 [Candidatus Saccharibacteria bacterium CPR2]|nr:hypothetical protein [Candidatus Saccharibacteria bacterium CPR2]